MPGRKDISVVKSVILAVGNELQEKGGGSEKIAAFASLINSYARLVRSNNSRLKPKHCSDGADPLYESIMKE